MIEGLELSERFFEGEVSPLIDHTFPTLRDRYAGGLIGYGSDVLGHDDEMSGDHEWGPRCIIWLRPRDYTRYAARLNQAFDQYLPRIFLGFPTRFTADEQAECLVPSPSGEGRHHVTMTTVARYMRVQLGLRRLPPDPLEWVCIPEQKLLEFTRGKVFRDPLGEITQARKILRYFPDDVWRFKLLYAWESLSWDVDLVGLCALRGDNLSVRLALQNTVERIIRIVFLLNRTYCPGTLKWISRELYALPEPATRTGRMLEECLIISDLSKIRPIIEEAIQTLVEEHNRKGITEKVVLREPEWFLRGQIGFSFSDITTKLRECLPASLRELEIQGACDQWITNDDVLLWPKHFMRFKHIYRSGHSQVLSKTIREAHRVADSR